MVNRQRYDVEINPPDGLDDKEMRKWLRNFAKEVARADRLRVTMVSGQPPPGGDDPVSQLPPGGDPDAVGIHFTFKLCSARLIEPKEDRLLEHVDFVQEARVPSTASPDSQGVDAQPQSDNS